MPIFLMGDNLIQQVAQSLIECPISTISSEIVCRSLMLLKIKEITNLVHQLIIKWLVIVYYCVMRNSKVVNDIY